MAAVAHVVGEVTPNALARAVDDVQGLAPGARVRRREGEDVGAVLYVGHRYTGQRADDQVVPPELLAQGGQVPVIASPDEAGPENGRSQPWARTTYRRGKSVQTTGTTPEIRAALAPAHR